MRSISLIFFYLPVFFLTLSIAPNYTSESINRTLVSLPLVYVSLIIVVLQLRDGEKSKRLLFGILFLVLTAVFTYLNFSYRDLLILAFALIILLPITAGLNYLTYTILGAGLSLLTYLGITGFEFAQLLKPDVVMFAVAGASLFLAFPSKSKWRGSPILFLIIQLLFLLYNGHLIYLWALLVAFLPMGIAALSRKEVPGWMEGFTIVTLLGFYLYYALFSTYLIQALQGGM